MTNNSKYHLFPAHAAVYLNNAYTSKAWIPVSVVYNAPFHECINDFPVFLYRTQSQAKDSYARSAQIREYALNTHVATETLQHFGLVAAAQRTSQR